MCFIISRYFNKNNGKPQNVIYLNHSKMERRKKEGKKKTQQHTISQIYLKVNLKNTY